jgi:hypothetical protein
MDDEPLYVESYGFRFNVQYNGFDDHMGDLGVAVDVLCRKLDSLGSTNVEKIWKEALAADTNVDTMGVTPAIQALEKMAFKAATEHWHGKHDAYIWLTAVRKTR